jgi:hypothetical protein
MASLLFQEFVLAYLLFPRVEMILEQISERPLRSYVSVGPKPVPCNVTTHGNAMHTQRCAMAAR